MAWNRQVKNMFSTKVLEFNLRHGYSYHTYYILKVLYNAINKANCMITLIDKATGETNSCRVNLAYNDAYVKISNVFQEYKDDLLELKDNRQRRIKRYENSLLRTDPERSNTIEHYKHLKRSIIDITKNYYE